MNELAIVLVIAACNVTLVAINLTLRRIVEALEKGYHK